MLAVLLLLAQPGCTIIGGVIGAATTAYQEVPTHRLAQMSPGTELRARHTSRQHERQACPPAVSTGPRRAQRCCVREPWSQGRLIAAGGGQLLLADDKRPGERTILEVGPCLEVEEPAGNYAGYGLVIGYGVDLLAAIVFFLTYDPELSLGGGGVW